jgi:hypothetical protein
MVILKREGIVPALGYLGLLIVWSVVSLAALVLSLFATNPLALGPIGVTLWFVLLLSSLAAASTVILYIIKTFLHVHEGAVVRRLRYSWRQGLLIGGWCVGVLALASLHQFGLRDAILLGLLLGIIEVYVRFRWP